MRTDELTGQGIGATAEGEAISPRQLARQVGVGVHMVLSWIGRGELGALNVASTPDGKRWRILPEHVAAFQAARSAKPAPAKPRRKKRPEFKRWI